MEQPVKVAMPLTVFTVLPPAQLRVPPPGFAPIDSVMEAVMPPVTTLPPASRTRTSGWSGNARPPVMVVGGVVLHTAAVPQQNCSPAAGPDVTLKLGPVVLEMPGSVVLAVSV